MTLNEEKCPDGQYYCNDSKKCKPIPKGHHVMPDGKLMKGEKHSMNEVAPPTKKHERMVKHIKKSYGKDGGLSDEEINKLDEEVNSLIEESVDQAKKSPLPNPEDVTKDVYVSY